MLTKKYVLQTLMKARADGYVNQDVRSDFSTFIEKQCEMKEKLLQKRQAEIVKCTAKGWIEQAHVDGEETTLDYSLHIESLIKQGELFYIEEEIEKRKALFYKDTLLKDEWIIPKDDTASRSNLSIDVQGEERSFSYNRLAAVQYAEKWWNEYNPKYKTFEVNCTNYVSQCLHAGGAPMRGQLNRAKGWWTNNKVWSYSWAVANSMYWFLKGSTVGLRAQEKHAANELVPGDIICYDFEGDGRWNHTTIVVAKDANAMPLVNANTYNSRMRYWAYEDSTAYTPNIKYAFFHIVDR
ncbi:amidase domain-containing protein [Bacillus sp. CGMCC 1.16541]|uniref:amidase domain-containing protein n=1 Tax=Bacillus sp. CGMCC 1.16541 TaxID=2185143 RepID=UPI000D732EB1|nr:amidase domain-containing protein [Bacillus sp. CGMCC 1.16541]